jgi:hypothetical protein
MNLSELSKEPVLIEFSIDDEATVKEYGEPLTFYSWDRQPLDVFMKLASAKHNDPGSMIDAIRPMILNSEGKQIIQGNFVLPSHILVKAITKLVKQLGNSLGQM